MLHLRLCLAQEHATTKPPFLFVGRFPLLWVSRIRNGSSYLFPLPGTAELPSWLVDFCKQQEQIISLFTFVQLSVFHYVFIIFAGPRKSQERILTLGWVRSKRLWELLLQNLPEGCHQTKTPALNFKIKETPTKCGVAILYIKCRKTPPFVGLPFYVPYSCCARDTECNALQCPDIKQKEKILLVSMYNNSIRVSRILLWTHILVLVRMLFYLSK